jgi:hypothetical protein
MFGGSGGTAAALPNAGSSPAAAPKPQPSASVSSRAEKAPALPPETKQVTPATVATPATSPVITQPEPPTVEAVETSAETSAAEPRAESPQAASSSDVKTLQVALSQALTEGGHETAGYMLESGTCEWNGTELRVRVAASKTLFELMYPATAQQLVKEAFRQTTGPGRTIRLEPGDSSAANGKKPQVKVNLASPADGGTRPQDHPLIRHAQQLFSAEVRSVVSLRDPQASKS